MKIFSRHFGGVVTVLFAALLILGCGSTTGTTSDDGDADDYRADTVSHQYLLVPNAAFESGSPSVSQTATAQKPNVAQPTTTTYTLNQTITWTVEFELITEIEVTEIVIYTEDLDGYFVYPLTDEEIAAGWVEIDTMLVDEEPAATQVCNRDYRGNGTCYAQADTGVTGLDFAATNIVGGDWTDYTVMSATVLSSDDGDDDADDDGGGVVSGDTTCSGWTALCSCNIRACCNDSSCWYDVGAGVYYCASMSNCTAAAQNATNYCTYGCY